MFKKNLCLAMLMGIAYFPAHASESGTKEPAQITLDQRITDANVTGHVLDVDSKEHLPGISVQVKGTNIGVITDNSGHFTLRNLKAGKVTILVQGVGYLKQEKTLTIEENETKVINFELKEDVMNLEELVVSSNRQQTLRKYAPTLVSVVDNKIFKQANAQNLAQGLTFQPGLRVENDCQNCGFNQVRINGLDGHFSQILIDSRPVFSALAGVYGLEQIPANMIDRVEIVRGGGSALFGSSAIAGVVNIITKDPLTNSFSFNENLSLTGGEKPDNTVSFNASVVSPDGRTGAMIFGQSREREPWDANGDGFSEIGKLVSRALGSRMFFRIDDQQKLTTEFHSIAENRRGGDHMEYPEHVASIAESIRHSIYSGNLKYDFFSADTKQHFQAYASGQIINRHSYYGGIGDDFVGSIGKPTPKEEYGENYGTTKGRTYMGGLQYTYDMDHLLFMPAQVLLGAEYVYDKLSDIMPIRNWQLAADGKTSLFPGIDQTINTWSQIAQVEWKNDYITVLLGTRLDENSAVKNDKNGTKPILSPRATLRWNPTESVNLRFSYAKGFRAPQIFDEDLHVGVVGGEAQKITNAPNLNPEYSHSLSLSSDMYFNTDWMQSNILLEGFYTKLIGAFNNESLGSKNGFKLFQRVNGDDATIMGFNMEGKFKFSRKFTLQGGLTLSSSKWDSPQGTGAERSLLSGETEDSPKDINTRNDNGPKDQSKFKTDKDGHYVNIELESDDFMRTPNVYGYVTMNYNPVKAVNLSLTANYTGSMYAPHVISWGTGTAKKDISLMKNGSRSEWQNPQPNDPDMAAPQWGVIEKTPSFWDLGAKVSYDFHLFTSSKMQLYLGVNNIFNAYQDDFDINGDRDSAYIYGPMLPRTFYMGLNITM